MPAEPRSRRRARRASVYVLVLATAAIATAAGLGGILVQRTRLRAAATNANIDAARLAAASGLEYALARIKNDPNWRTSIGAGSWLDSAALGNATLSVSVVDPEGDAIASDPVAPIVVQTLGRSGAARQAFDATIEFDRTSFSALQCAAYSGFFTYTELTTLTADAPVHSAGDMNALVATVNADAEAVGTISGLTYARATQSGASARTAPDASLISGWAAMSTPIPMTYFGGRKMWYICLNGGGSFNGYTPGTGGVYVIDCGGGDFIIQNCRIRATLVLVNARVVTVTSSVRIDPYTSGYPSLIVQGQIRFQVSTAPLDERAGGAINFNPPGAPYLGVSDTDRLDTYPSGISGIVFATDDIIVDNNLTVTGTLITLDSLTVRKPLTITYDPALLTSGAPGFSGITPRLAAAGVERVAR
ncbi:MAG: hypothetical protein KDA05_09355 [Phycisphaerales bacterium]|nr:hypothetical protein [Phycisphaerales bacterium]